MKRDTGILLGALAVAGLIAYLMTHVDPKPRRVPVLPEGNIQPEGYPGDQIVFGSHVDMLPKAIPHLHRTPDWIPSDAFDAMTRIGNVNQPELLMNVMLSARFQTAPIPEVLHLPPTPNRAPEDEAHSEADRIWSGSRR